jgi:hypothetical protein
MLPTVLDFAESMVQNAGSWWDQLPPDARQELQRLLFPSGVIYANNACRTAGKSLFTELLEACKVETERMVAQIFPRWNPLTSWMRQIEDFQRAA